MLSTISLVVVHHQHRQLLHQLPLLRGLYHTKGFF